MSRNSGAKSIAPACFAAVAGFIAMIAVWYVGLKVPESWQHPYLTVCWIPVFVVAWFAYTRVDDAVRARSK